VISGAARRDLHNPQLSNALQKLKTWGAWLHQYRTNQRMSLHDLGDRCGVNAGKVDEWERGLSYPQAQQMKRLYASIREMRGHAEFLPKGARESHIEAEKLSEAERTAFERSADPKSVNARPKVVPLVAAVKAAPPPAVVETVKAPPIKTTAKVFGDALIAAREKAGMSRADVARQIGVTNPNNIRNYETAFALPLSHTYERLCNVFPELRKLPVPEDLKTTRKVKGFAPADIVRSMPAIAPPPAAAATPPPPPPAPALVVAPPPPPPLETAALDVLGVRYARAMMEVTRISRALEAVMAQAEALDADLARAKLAVEEAQKEIVAATSAKDGMGGGQ
jgi:transcriptional regulator with XRE-family HTH domain